MYKVNLTWVEENSFELGFNIYRDTSPLDIDNLPPPIATLPPDSVSWVDESPPQDTTVYYIVSTFDEDEEVYDDEVSVVVGTIGLKAPVISSAEISGFFYELKGVAEYQNPDDAFIYSYDLYNASTDEHISQAGVSGGVFRYLIAVGTAVTEKYYVKVSMVGTDTVSDASNIVGLDVPEEVLVVGTGSMGLSPRLAWNSGVPSPFEHSVDLVYWQDTVSETDLLPGGSSAPKVAFIRTKEGVDDGDITSVSVLFRTVGASDYLAKWWDKPYHIMFANEGRTTFPSYLPPTITNTSRMFANSQNFNPANIVTWDTRNVTNMDSMFSWCTYFNQDLSGWYVPLIPSKPTGFDSSTPTWVKEGRQPRWGVSPP